LRPNQSGLLKYPTSKKGYQCRRVAQKKIAGSNHVLANLSLPRP
jgi:hypothetical protein